MAKHNMTGGLWPNKYKTSSDKKPDFLGTITIGNVTHKIAGWHTDGAGNKPVVSLVVEQPQPKPECFAAPSSPTTPALGSDWESDIPF